MAANRRICPPPGEPERERLNTLIAAANSAYPDGFLLTYWNSRLGRPKPGFGDTLAKFVVLEVNEVARGEPTFEAAREAAAMAIRRAAEELCRVAEALEVAAEPPLP